MSLKDKTIVVTGGSRGLGLGLVEALVDQGAKVTVVARDPAALAAVEQKLSVAVISADVTDEGAAKRILADVRPEVLVLNAGATPRMGRLDQLSWPDFTAPWETDVKAGLYWIQAALNLPLGDPTFPRFPLPQDLFRYDKELTHEHLPWRQTHALVHGQLREWDRQAEGAGHPLSGDRASADNWRDRGWRRGV